MNQLIRIIMFLCLVLGFSLYADELKFKNGHLVAGDLVTIRLTKDQMELVKKGNRPNFHIRLTTHQRSILRKVYKKTAPPTEIGVFRQIDLDGGCSCGLINFGVLYKANALEIPIRSLCSDKEAEKFYGPPEQTVVIVQ